MHNIKDIFISLKLLRVNWSNKIVKTNVVYGPMGQSPIAPGRVSYYIWGRIKRIFQGVAFKEISYMDPI